MLGPRDISYAEATRILGERIGKPDLQYVQFSYADQAKALVQAGMSESFASLYVEMTRAFNEGTVKPGKGEQSRTRHPPDSKTSPTRLPAPTRPRRGRLSKKMNRLTFVLTFASALGSGLVAGIFFAFSTFIMRALGRLPAVQGIAAMQSVNVMVINRWFFAAFFGTAACCLVLAICCFFWWHKPGAIYLLIGSLIYLVGTI